MEARVKIPTEFMVFNIYATSGGKESAGGGALLEINPETY